MTDNFESLWFLWLGAEQPGHKEAPRVTLSLLGLVNRKSLSIKERTVWLFALSLPRMEKVLGIAAFLQCCGLQQACFTETMADRQWMHLSKYRTENECSRIFFENNSWHEKCNWPLDFESSARYELMPPSARKAHTYQLKKLCPQRWGQLPR